MLLEDSIMPVETTKNYKHTRIKSPSYFDKSSFRTIDPGRTGYTKLRIGCKKGHYKSGECNIGTEVQSISEQVNSRKKVLLAVLIIGLLVADVYLAYFFSFDAYSERYAVRYSRQECLDSIWCPQVFKDSYSNQVSTKDLVNAIKEGND